ncbi:hypothetical protein ACIRPR_33500 [Streptomyces griseoflavus]|uniref:hypothetical protein n=1 Tax=Streptomyces griseoflavus TaxID=35619 RepID=UPI0037F75612
MSNWSEQRRLDKAADREQDREDKRLAIEGRLEAERLRAEETRKNAETEAKLKRQRDAEKAKSKALRKQQQAAARKRALAAVTAHMPIAGIPVVAASMAMAWGGQYEAAHAAGFGAYSIGVPLMLEGLTLTLATLTSAAMTAKKPHASLMTWTWASAFVAAALNGYGHIIEGGPGAVLKAVVFAVASLVGVFLWWRVATAHTATRTRAERAEDRRRAKHSEDRRKRFKEVAERANDIMLAHPYGTVTEEDAWRTAWMDEHAMDVSRTAAVTRKFQAAEAVAESLSAVALRRQFHDGVDGWLSEVLDEGDGGPAGSVPRKPSGGPSEGATTLGGIGKRALSRRPRKDAVEPLSEADLDAARKLADAVPAEQFSTPAIAKLLGRSKVYAKRVRDAVQSERGNG